MNVFACLPGFRQRTTSRFCGSTRNRRLELLADGALKMMDTERTELDTLMANSDVDKLYKSSGIVLASCEYGRGVFAAEFLPSDTTLEECPFLRIPKSDCCSVLDEYVFMMDPGPDGEDENYYSMVLGWGSLFNHADNHNTEYWHDQERDLIVFHTIRDVSAGEQLFINYGCQWWQSRELEPLAG